MRRIASFGMAVAMLAATAMPLTFLHRDDAASILSVVPQRRRVVRRAGNGGWGRLNRSTRWRPARSYLHARQISPFPDRAVR